MRREEGFTLLEVLVALTILGLALSVLFAIFGHSLARSRETQSRMEARVIAEGLLAQAETAPTVALGQTTGRSGSGMAWRFDVRRFGSDQDTQAWPAQAVEMTATVRWGDGSDGKSFSLSTLRLIPKEQSP